MASDSGPVQPIIRVPLDRGLHVRRNLSESLCAPSYRSVLESSDRPILTTPLRGRTSRLLQSCPRFGSHRRGESRHAFRFNLNLVPPLVKRRRKGTINGTRSMPTVNTRSIRGLKPLCHKGLNLSLDQSFLATFITIAQNHGTARVRLHYLRWGY